MAAAGTLRTGRVSGSVTAFDDWKGYGTVAAGNPATAAWPFHCTAIADGSRRVEIGAEVSFVVVPGRQGRWEAADLRPA